ncbi:MAG: 30S ribosomal protein S1 [Chlamydiia bacterium]|nr:30S ribosomal protein S1 [Chlamydiia bacterium]
MTNQQQQNSWLEDQNIIGEVEVSQEDRDLFASLLDEKETSSDAGAITNLTEGHILTGTVVEITKDFVIVDVGLKSEGLIPIEEFGKDDEVAVGGETEVYIERAESESGQIILSREKAKRQRRWEEIVNNCDEGFVVSGTVSRKVKGGLMIDIQGLEAFLPGSQLSHKPIKFLDDFIGQTFDVKILKINEERKNIVVSRRELLEDERLTRKAEVLENIKEGDLRKGVVKNITDFGVFLDLDGIDGLLHVTDMTWKRIRHPSEMVALGDELEVVILNIDRDKGRVALGLKQKHENPWDKIEQNYPPGTLVEGQIVNLVPYGAFIEIEPGIEGLIHVSEMSWTKNVTDPGQIVNRGDKVKAIVLSIQKDEGKISLGIKQTEKNPWEDVENNYPCGKVVRAEIRNLTNYGAFVELEPGVEGLIHISDLSWIKKVSHPSELLNKGDVVDAMVLSVDKASKKITLGVKQLTDNPWDTLEKTLPIGSKVTGKVTKITAFGAFIELESGIEGLVHVTELSDKAFGKVEDIVTVGSEVEATVRAIDPEQKKINLSIKDFIQENGGSVTDDIVLEAAKDEKKN